MAVKHWKTAGNKLGVRRYSNTQPKPLFDLFSEFIVDSMPPLLLNRIISKKATAKRYVAFTPAYQAKQRFKKLISVLINFNHGK